VTAPEPAPVVPARTAIARAGPIAEPAILPWLGRRKRRGGRGLALRGGAAERRTRRGDDPGRLGAHPEDAPAARGQDLEVEVVQLDAELLARDLERLFHALARELSVRTHQRRLPRRPWRPRSLWRMVFSA